MKRLSSFGVCAWVLPLVLASVVACGDDSPDPPPSGPGKAVWKAAFDTSDTGSLSGVWGSGPSDVFVVGGTEGGGEIYHYDGANWSPMSHPVIPLLVWVFGFGPNDVYSVGLDGAMLHYDGGDWSVIDPGTTEDLWGIFGFSPDELWIVGGDPNDGEPLVLRYDGTDFTTVAVDPSENVQGASALFKVWGIGSELFAVGQLGLILRWNGTKWVASPAGAAADQDFVSLWGTGEDHIVAVGGRNNARIAVWDGSTWDTVSPPALGGLNAVHLTDPDVAVVGGVFGFVGSFDPATKEVTQEAEELTRVDLHAIWGDGEGRHYAVGGTFLPPHEGAVLVRTVE